MHRVSVSDYNANYGKGNIFRFGKIHFHVISKAVLYFEMKEQVEKQVIGRREFVDFPDLGLKHIEAKIDTGAYTNALHCHSITIKNSDKGKILCFKLLDSSHPVYNQKEMRFADYNEKYIKNSSGESEKRYIIKTRILIAGKLIRSIISLTDRGKMKYPVLIGRKMLKNKFIVDVGKKHLHEPDLGIPIND